jgi:hypothetical protein
MTSPYLEELEIAFGRPETYNSIVEFENEMSTSSALSMWKALDRVLSAMSSLRVVRLTLGSYHWPFLAKYAKMGLSSCNKRGILCFERAAGPLTGMLRR